MKRIALTALLGLVACGGAPMPPAPAKGNTPTTPTTFARSCDIVMGETHICLEYSGSGNTMDQVSSECGAAMGKVLAACPTAGLVGTCIRNGGMPTEYKAYYFTGSLDANRLNCTGGDGMFTPATPAASVQEEAENPAGD
jgi:hypothetical protein